MRLDLEGWVPQVKEVIKGQRETKVIKGTRGHEALHKQVFEVRKDRRDCKEILVQWVLQALWVKNVGFQCLDLVENGVSLGWMDLQGPWG